MNQNSDIISESRPSTIATLDLKAECHCCWDAAHATWRRDLLLKSSQHMLLKRGTHYSSMKQKSARL